MVLQVFSNIFIPTVNCWALVMVNYSTFLFLWVLLHGLNQKFFESSISFEMGLYTIFAAHMFDALPQALNVWDDHVSHTGSSPGGSVCWLLSLEVLVSCVVVPTWLLLLTLPSQLPYITLFCTLLIAHLQYCTYPGPL